MKRLASFLGCPPWMQPKATLSPAWTTACCGPLLSLWWFVHNILVPGAKKWTWHSRYGLRSSEQRWQSLAFRSLLAMTLLMQPGGCWPSISVAGPCWPCPAAHRASGCSAELLLQWAKTSQSASRGSAFPGPHWISQCHCCLFHPVIWVPLRGSLFSGLHPPSWCHLQTW